MNGKIYKYFNRKKFEEEGIKKYYIGQTIRSVKRRAGSNGNCYLKDSNTKFANAIKKWGWDAFECEILEECIESYDELNRLEQKYIAEYDSFNNGYNTTIGGDATPSIKVKKKVYCPELNMIFDSISDAALYIKLKTGTNISKVCKGERKYAGLANINGIDTKLTWKFVDSSYVPLQNSYHDVKIPDPVTSKKVYCPELNMTFNTLVEAANYIGLAKKGSSHITQVCKGKRPYAGTYTINEELIQLTWKYID